MLVPCYILTLIATHAVGEAISPWLFLLLLCYYDYHCCCYFCDYLCHSCQACCFRYWGTDGTTSFTCAVVTTNATAASAATNATTGAAKVLLLIFLLLLLMLLFLFGCDSCCCYLRGQTTGVAAATCAISVTNAISAKSRTSSRLSSICCFLA